MWGSNWQPCWPSRGVAPKVNLREHVTHIPQPSLNKAAHSALKPRGGRHHQRSKTGELVATQKVTNVLQKFTQSNNARMRTAHSVTVCRSHSICLGGACMSPLTTHVPLPHMPPGHAHPPAMHAPGHTCPPAMHTPHTHHPQPQTPVKI